MRLFSFVVPLGLVMSLAACSGDSSPTAPPLVTATTIDAVGLSFGGVPWSGGVVTGDLGPALFSIRLHDRDQFHLQSLAQCSISFDRPGPGAGGPRATGARLCFDDGTNGDITPGDGVCHYLDADDAIGCGRDGMRAGDYIYRFECRFMDGGVSQMSLAVTRR